MVRSYNYLTLKVLAIGAALIVGMALSPAARAVALHPLGTTQQANDPGTILGVVNTNPAGGAIIGQVGPYQTATAPGAGVYGTFNAATGTGEGILGVGINGYGIIAEQYGGYFPALYAQNYSPLGGPGIQSIANGVSILGQSVNTDGIYGTTTATNTSATNTYAGVVGQDTTTDPANANNVGVFGSTQNGTAGVLGRTESSTGAGVIGGSTGGFGVAAVSNSSAGLIAANQTSSLPQLFIDALTGTGAKGEPMIIATNAKSVDVLSLDQAGNLIVSGSVTQNGSPMAKVKATSGAKLTTYSTQQTRPATEDVGEARLTNGAAYIHLEPAFSSIIDKNSSYLVFITPLGNSHSLFVQNRSASGFEVHESEYGHASIAFDYRIIAKPYDTGMTRLPAGASLRLGSERAARARFELKLLNLRYKAHAAPKRPKHLLKIPR